MIRRVASHRQECPVPGWCVWDPYPILCLSVGVGGIRGRQHICVEVCDCLTRPPAGSGPVTPAAAHCCPGPPASNGMRVRRTTRGRVGRLYTRVAGAGHTVNIAASIGRSRLYTVSQYSDHAPPTTQANRYTDQLMISKAQLERLRRKGRRDINITRIGVEI